MKRVVLTSLAVLAMVLSSSLLAVGASGIRIQPGVFDPDKTGTVDARWVTKEGTPDPESTHALYLAKMTATSTNAAAGANIEGVAGLTLRNLGFDYRTDGHCGAGSPRFNVGTTQGTYFFFGCAHGDAAPLAGAPGWNRVRFSNADAFPADGVTPWPGFGNAVVEWMQIIFDEGTDVGPGFVYLDNININGALVGKPGNTEIPTFWSLFGGAQAADDGAPAPGIGLFSTSTVPFSGVSYRPATGLTFAGITNLSTSFRIESGDCGGGSPRFQVRVDSNGDGSGDATIHIAIGPAPSFTGCAAGWQTSGNLIGSTDPRYDIGQVGGSSFTDYAAARAAAGGLTVTGITLVIDSGWMFPTGQIIVVDNITVNSDVLQQAP